MKRKLAPEIGSAKLLDDNRGDFRMSEDEAVKLAFLAFSPWLAHFLMYRWVNREQRHKDRRK